MVIILLSLRSSSKQQIPLPQAVLLSKVPTMDVKAILLCFA